MISMYISFSVSVRILQNLSESIFSQNLAYQYTYYK